MSEILDLTQSQEVPLTVDSAAVDAQSTDGKEVVSSANEETVTQNNENNETSSDAEVIPAAEAQETEDDEALNDVADKRTYENRNEILERMAEIAAVATDAVKNEISHLRLLYYKMRQQETDAEMRAYLDGDGDPSAYESKPDELEPRLKELLDIQKEARAAMVKAREDEFATNLQKKREILDQMEEIACDAEGVGQKYNAFQALQKQFKEVGQVDQQEITGLWKRYQQLNEQFYDALKINKELRDYDFRKNLEAKELICQEAERLSESTDIVAAFRQLQEMHEQWRIIGPVSPSVREELWNRFKAASTVINKRHQEHFETLKAQEQANEADKASICDKIAAIDFTAINSVKGWDDATKVILGFQEEWRKLGFASKRVNTQLFERFRQLCDSFFTQKADFFKQVRGEQGDNLQKKIALCEQAEALSDSKEWRKTTEKLIALQNEWKTIGPTARRNSQQIWERFKTACDAFFKAKEENTGGERAAERANLESKQSIIAKLQAMREDAELASAKAVRALMDEWATIGHVPFRDKDKLQAKYRELIDFFFERLDMRGSGNGRRRSDNRDGQPARNNTREAQNTPQRRLERLKADLKIYENNLGFLTVKSKNGAGMISLMQGKMEELRAEIAKLENTVNENTEASEN